MSAIDPVAYVRSTPPFQALPGALFDEAVRALEVGFYPAGTVLVRAGGAPLAHLYVIRKGSVRLEREGQTIQILEEGETFGYTSLVGREATLDAVVEEDLLAYLLPDAEFQRLRADAGFAGHFALGLVERLRASLDHSPVVTFQPDLAQPVAALLRRPAVWVNPSATVADAARAMRDARVSSVLVRGDPPGIVTDRDLTDRVLAEGLGAATPLERIVSRPLRALPAETPLHEAWAALLAHGARHVAVLRDGAIAGVVTATDLLRSSAQGPIAVLRRVERLEGRGSLPGHAQQVAEMAAALLAGGLDVPSIAGLVARLEDALVARLLAWAEADLGPPPAPYAWTAFGSEGRREQALLTDQDNALVYGDAGADARPYWQELAERVNADLEAAGVPACRHGHMARQSHGTVSEWLHRFVSCVDERRPLAATLLFDFRKVGGALDLDPLEAARARAAKNAPFLRFLARNAVEHKPPASVALRLRSDASPLDLKADGIVPVVALARCYAVETGSPARGTLERLAAAARAGLVSQEAHGRVGEAYRFLLALRLRRQLTLLSERRPPGDTLSMDELGAVERSRLKEAFREIRAWQERAAYHYRTDFF